MSTAAERVAAFLDSYPEIGLDLISTSRDADNNLHTLRPSDLRELVAKVDRGESFCLRDRDGEWWAWSSVNESWWLVDTSRGSTLPRHFDNPSLLVRVDDSDFDTATARIIKMYGVWS